MRVDPHGYALKSKLSLVPFKPEAAPTGILSMLLDGMPHPVGGSVAPNPGPRRLNTCKDNDKTEFERPSQ
jgi:hypothetical protein